MSISAQLVLDNHALIPLLSDKYKKQMINRIALNPANARKFIQSPIAGMIYEQMQLLLLHLQDPHAMQIGNINMELISYCVLNGLKIPYKERTIGLFNPSSCGSVRGINEDGIAFHGCAHSIMFHPEHLHNHPDRNTMIARLNRNAKVAAPCTEGTAPYMARFYLDNLENRSLSGFLSRFAISRETDLRAMLGAYATHYHLSDPELHQLIGRIKENPAESPAVLALFATYHRRNGISSIMPGYIDYTLTDIWTPAVKKEASIVTVLYGLRHEWLDLTPTIQIPKKTAITGWKDQYMFDQQLRGLKHFRAFARLIQYIDQPILEKYIPHLRYPPDEKEMETLIEMF